MYAIVHHIEGPSNLAKGYKEGKTLKKKPNFLVHMDNFSRTMASDKDHLYIIKWNSYSIFTRSHTQFKVEVAADAISKKYERVKISLKSKENLKILESAEITAFVVDDPRDLIDLPPTIPKVFYYNESGGSFVIPRSQTPGNDIKLLFGPEDKDIEIKADLGTLMTPDAAIYQQI